MIKTNKLFLISILFFSCRSGKQLKELSAKDSSQIFITALNSKSFLKENLNYSDTLFFIKNRNYHSYYPLKSEYFKLFYIEDKIQNKTLNMPNRHVDKRERYEITKFEKASDTVVLELYNFGVREAYDYKFLYQKGQWIIIDEQSSVY